MEMMVKNGKFDNLINKFLKKIGLMKISTAKNMGEKLHLHYVNCVVDAVERDFGVKKQKQLPVEVKEWWGLCFDKLLKSCDSEFNITTPAMFDEYKKQS